MLLVDAKRGRHGVFADFIYTDVRSDEELLPSPISLMLRSVTKTTIFSLAYQYEIFSQDQAVIDLMLGARYWDIDSELSFGPDIDNARTFVFQKFWYSQSVTHAGMVGGVGGASTDAPRQSFNGSSYFSDGKRMVFFLSDSPVAMDELELLYTTGTNP